MKLIPRNNELSVSITDIPIVQHSLQDNTHTGAETWTYKHGGWPASSKRRNNKTSYIGRNVDTSGRNKPMYLDSLFREKFFTLEKSS